jgi:5-methylcytosine-specific restriction enzyme B
MSTFTWIPFYKELAEKILAYRSRQNELIAMLKELKAEGLPVVSLDDKSAKNKTISLSTIDPFTFFAAFNRKATEQNRMAILAKIKERFQVQAAVPTDFSGIPVMHPMKARFIAWQYERKPDDVESLWAFVEAFVTRAPEDIPENLFNRCLAVRCVSVTNLTMGMFWMRPESYLALDSRNRALLDERGVKHEVKDWATYRQFLAEAKTRIPETPYEFSEKAPGLSSECRYWVFQCNPKVYDLAGALKAGVVKSWQVNQHRSTINIGDKVILWVTGNNGGCYALGTVMSRVESLTEDARELPHYLQRPKKAAHDRVKLQIEMPLWEHPIKQSDIIGLPGFENFPAGRQGTNFPATKEHYDGILALTRGRTTMRYWIYAPGENARFWDECYNKGVMLYGSDELMDLRQFNSQAAIEKAIIKVKKLKRRPYNESLASWQFVHEVKPGDMVIAKKGKATYLGYGIVSGGYERDESRTSYRNVRRVQWLKKGEWPAVDRKIVTKALTDVTKDGDYIQKLRILMGLDIESFGAHKPSLPALNIILYGPPVPARPGRFAMTTWNDSRSARPH